MDPRKAFYKGGLIPIQDIPDEEEDREEASALKMSDVNEERVATPGPDIVGLSD